MDYRKLGSTGIDVSRTCLGMMSFGSPKWQPWVAAGDRAIDFVRHALELGINFFDTADFYSWGLSEQALGDAVSALTDRSKVVLSTKAGLPMHGGPNGGGLSRKHLLEAIDGSLRRLSTDYLDVFTLHHDDPTVPIEETVDALDVIVRSGRALTVGVSNFFTWELARFERRMGQVGMRDFGVIQLQYNLAYREEERELLPFAEASGIGTMIYSPLARGLLARADDDLGCLTASERLRAHRDEKARALYGTGRDTAVTAALREVAREIGEPPSSVAVAWLLSKRAVTTVLSGATELSHLDEAVRAIEVELTDDQVARLEAPYVAQELKSDQLELAGGSALTSRNWWHKQLAGGHP